MAKRKKAAARDAATITLMRWASCARVLRESMGLAGV